MRTYAVIKPNDVGRDNPKNFSRLSKSVIEIFCVTASRLIEETVRGAKEVVAEVSLVEKEGCEKAAGCKDLTIRGTLVSCRRLQSRNSVLK